MLEEHTVDTPKQPDPNQTPTKTALTKGILGHPPKHLPNTPAVG